MGKKSEDEMIIKMEMEDMAFVVSEYMADIQCLRKKTELISKMADKIETSARELTEYNDKGIMTLNDSHRRRMDEIYHDLKELGDVIEQTMDRMDDMFGRD